MRQKSKRLRPNGVTKLPKPTGESLLARDDIDLVDIACPNDMHKEIAIAAAKAGKMILCEKPLSMDGPEGLKMVEAVEKAGVPNMVWYNYRRVPAVTLAKQLIDEGQARPHLPLSREVPPGLDDFQGLAPGRRRAVATGRESRGQRRHRRSAGPLHRHRALAQRRHRQASTP